MNRGNRLHGDFLCIKLHVGTPDGAKDGTGHGNDNVEQRVPKGFVHVF